MTTANTKVLAEHYGVSPNRRLFGASTDDAAIFLDDTVDRTTAQCISASPSAVAILSPQRMPTTQRVDVTEYDADNMGPAGRRSAGRCDSSGSQPLSDVTNTMGRLSFGASPAAKASSVSLGYIGRASGMRGRSSRVISPSTSPAAAEPMVTLSELEAVERERNRYQKMYEHQKALYEEMADKHAETHQSLQDKIVEVVALSTRNEESKKFIRQLKREMSESRTRVMDIQNRALEETRAERHAKGRYEALIEEHERKHDIAVERHEAKMAGMESLLKDLTSLSDNNDGVGDSGGRAIHISQLDSLLRASYAKNTSLFNDLLRQGRQFDLLHDSKLELERQIDELRREKRDMEAAHAEDRRRMMYETERFVEQVEDQQQSILSLRQMLIRTMDCANTADGKISPDPDDGPRAPCNTTTNRPALKDHYGGDGGTNARRSSSTLSSNSVRRIPSSIAAEPAPKASFHERHRPSTTIVKSPMVQSVSISDASDGAYASKSDDKLLPQRKRMDYSTALAAIARKREQDRTDRALTEAASQADKENRPVTTAKMAAQHVVRHSAINKTRHSISQQEDDDNDDDVPKLAPRAALRTISQRTSDVLARREQLLSATASSSRRLSPAAD